MQTGDLIAYRYQLIQPHHSSWLAIDQISGQNCLLKPVSSFVDPQVVSFLEKVWHVGLPRLLGREWIPRVTGNGVQTSEEYFIFEHRPGRSLKALAAGNDGRVPASQLLPLIRQAAGILAYLHLQGEQPVLHLDLKPDHIILGPDGQVSLIDFGAAQIYTKAESSDIKTAASRSNLPEPCSGLDHPHALTPEFAAPEQLAGHPCPGSDIYSLGLTLLHLLSGKPADVCRCRPVYELLPGTETQQGLHRLLGRCLLSDPAVRLSDAHEFYSAISTEIMGHDQIPRDMVLSDIKCNSDEEAELNKINNVGEIDEIDSLDSHANEIEENSDVLHADQAIAPLICVWGNAEFGCELAGMLAEKQDILMIDADLLNPQADLLLDCKSKVPDETIEYQPQGLDLALTEEQRGHLDAPMLSRMMQPTRLDRVKLLATRASLDHYDYFDLDSLDRVLHLARLISGQVIILCSRFIFDAFTCLCLMAADWILVPRSGDNGSFRESNRSLRALSSRHHLALDKVWFAAFDYRADLDLSRGTLNELCDGRLAGCISARDKRRSMKCGALPYAANLDRVNRNEYLSIIRRLHLATLKDRNRMKEII